MLHSFLKQHKEGTIDRDPVKHRSPDLTNAMRILAANQADLRQRGVRHAAIFGSVARSQATASSDIDILIELDPNHSMDIFEYARLKLFISGLLGGNADVVSRRTLKPLLRESILEGAVSVF
jgi:predicted nucleotidyltransferase